MSFIDLHLHLLPGLDDGPHRLEASVTHARRLAEDGVVEATVTPHVAHPDFSVDVREIADRTAGLQDVLDRLGIPLRLHPGGEVRALGALRMAPTDLDHVAQGPQPHRWVLLEPSFDGIDATFLKACDHVRACGFGIVVAHPERCRGFLRAGLPRLRGELQRGALLQVSTCSLLGLHGPAALAAGTAMVRDGSAALIASDGHGGVRGHTLADGYRLALAAGVTAGRARELVQWTPSQLLRDGIPATVAPRSQRGNQSQPAHA